LTHGAESDLISLTRLEVAASAPVQGGPTYYRGLAMPRRPWRSSHL